MLFRGKNTKSNIQITLNGNFINESKNNDKMYFEQISEDLNKCFYCHNFPCYLIQKLDSKISDKNYIRTRLKSSESALEKTSKEIKRWLKKVLRCFKLRYKQRFQNGGFYLCLTRGLHEYRKSFLDKIIDGARDEIASLGKYYEKMTKSLNVKKEKKVSLVEFLF